MSPSPIIPLVDLQAQYAALGPEIDRAVRSVLKSGRFILGPETEAFERELAAYCGTPHAVGVASGTDALELTLRALRIGPGDEVIVPALTFMASALAVVLAGATPVFVDVEAETCTLDAGRLDRAMTRRTRAILPVHLFGHPADFEAILPIARKHKVWVIEDCAQAIGASFKGRRVGSFGEAGALSFYPSKNLGGYGDGGAVVTRDATLARRLRMLRWYGTPDRLRVVYLGRNSRLDELQAAVLRVKLRHLEEWTKARRRRARVYEELFARYGLASVTLPKTRPGYAPVYSLYPIRLSHRDAVHRALRSQGLGVQIHYDRILPEQPLLSRFARRRRFPVARRLARTLLSLPLYPELSVGAMERIVRAIRALHPTP